MTSAGSSVNVACQTHSDIPLPDSLDFCQYAMAEVATKPKGLRARLGFASKNDSSRKLAKKAEARDNSDVVDKIERSATYTSSRRGLSITWMDSAPAPPRRKSAEYADRADRTKERKPLDRPKVQRKLSKAPPTMVQTDSSTDSEESIASPRAGMSTTWVDPWSKPVSKANRADQHQGLNELRAPRKVPETSQKKKDVIDKDTGERKDITDMLHAFSYAESAEHSDESVEPDAFEYDPFRPDGARLLSRLPIDIWALIADHLSPLDIAHLTMTSRTAYHLTIRILNPLLRDPVNRTHRQNFLLAMSPTLPNHLFCFPCATWHLRTHPGFESLKPSTVLNPVFHCPNSTNNLYPAPRLRLTEGRTLPFTFVQLAKRHWAYGSTYGIPVASLARRWKDTDSPWRHETKYHIHNNGHVLVRIKSSVFVDPGMTPAGKRLLLFSRGDYTPYFSVCAHWRSGILTSVPKCALDHIPVPKDNALAQTRQRKVPGPVSLCSTCRPIRRCPDCPTEYLVEIKLVEDRSVKSHGPDRFKLALEVSRWSDLGIGESPEDKEWAAVTGGGDGEQEKYDSFKEIGGRGVSGVFESAFSDALPGQRVESMRPGRVDGRVDHADDESWY
jgi:hypothetical protein